ncbi:hypothetical protein [Bordetella petrii]|uniref:hypothetical protein n=1 Tax=Bordetella petrii TaxID=94624 RepID=UPI001E40D25A|nr:hypothetical protein [Bordetella petrii]MCD0501733.1 hypothetical protein [Bordetella petrii]
MLQSDEAMAAILPVAAWKLSLGDISLAPFCLHSSEQIVKISPALLDNAPALSVAARWGLELARVRDENYCSSSLAAVLYHGNRLLARIDTVSRNLFLSLLPESIAATVWDGGKVHLTQNAIEWLHSLASTNTSISPVPALERLPELATPLEDILIAGGDSRLSIDPSSGYNRYGVPPRPRPDAVHFSSSTASAISDYGFAFCELLRQQLLRIGSSDATAQQVVRRASSAMEQHVLRMLGSQANEADVLFTASGTDSEWAAVLVSKAGNEGRPLTNILIAPEETGSGVASAGAGCYFDDIIAFGDHVEKGALIWPEQRITVEKVAIRGTDGAPRSVSDIDNDFLTAGKSALSRGDRVLAHVLFASKTGLVAPSTSVVNKLVALAPDQVDVVVDACQMRMSFRELSSAVERGWMLQVSGSKFLTGPPFSGALVLPNSFRSRLQSVRLALDKAPHICPSELWGDWWSNQLTPSATAPSYGSLFRWFPALMEARLLDTLPESFRRSIFDQFRTTLIQCIDRTPYLQPISIGEMREKEEEFARQSIVSFQVMGRTWDGALRALDEPECRYLFEMLNKDVSLLFSDLRPTELALAKQKFHIGQPVTLRTCTEQRTVLRLVVGARFFTIVGFAGEDASMAALDSEIADATRAIAKIDMLASRWWRLPNFNHKD